MKIKEYEQYIINCKDFEGQSYRWHLDVRPGNKSFKLVGKNIHTEDRINGYYILSISRVTNTTRGKLEIILNHPPILPCFYACNFCDGIVINNCCSECQFDWDN